MVHQMWYTEYEEHIVQAHSILLQGWTSQIVASLMHEIGLQPNKGHISSWAVAHHLSVGEPAVYSGWGQ